MQGFGWRDGQPPSYEADFASVRLIIYFRRAFLFGPFKTTISEWFLVNPNQR